MEDNIIESQYNACPNCGEDDYISYVERYADGKHWVCEMCEYRFCANDPEEQEEIESKGIGSEASAPSVINKSYQLLAELTMFLAAWEEIKDKPFSEEHREILTELENSLTW